MLHVNGMLMKKGQFNENYFCFSLFSVLKFVHIAKKIITKFTITTRHVWESLDINVKHVNWSFARPCTKKHSHNSLGLLRCETTIITRYNNNYCLILTLSVNSFHRFARKLECSALMAAEFCQLHDQQSITLLNMPHFYSNFSFLSSLWCGK